MVDATMSDASRSADRRDRHEHDGGGGGRCRRHPEGEEAGRGRHVEPDRRDEPHQEHDVEPEGQLSCHGAGDRADRDDCEEGEPRAPRADSRREERRECDRVREVGEHEDARRDGDAGGEPAAPVTLANISRGVRRAARAAELRPAGDGSPRAHGFGTSSITVVPDPGDEKIRARPPTVFSRPTTDSA